MSKKQFWKNGASKKVKAFVLIGSIYSLVLAGFVTIGIAIAVSMMIASNAVGQSVISSVLWVSGVTVGANLIFGLWLLIGKSRVASLLLIAYQIFNLVIRFVFGTPELGAILFVCFSFAIYLLAVFGAFGLEKEYRGALASQNRQ